MIVSDHGFKAAATSAAVQSNRRNGIGRREFSFFMDRASVPMK
jgi:hypothetical protein